jgi:hypothetical protein
MGNPTFPNVSEDHFDGLHLNLLTTICYIYKFDFISDLNSFYVEFRSLHQTKKCSLLKQKNTESVVLSRIFVLINFNCLPFRLKISGKA